MQTRYEIVQKILVMCAVAASVNVATAAPQGIRPTAPDGRVLNLGFEDGTYTDWKVEGNAFGDKPVQGDAIFARREGHEEPARRPVLGGVV